MSDDAPTDREQNARVIPDYRSSDVRPASNSTSSREVYAALLCGALPLAAGVSIFLLWLATRASFFQVAGFLTILAGLVLVAGGGLLWLVHLLKTLQQSAGAQRRKQLFLSCTALVLLIANFPVCFLILGAVARVESSFIVQVQNTGALAVTSASVTFDGTTHQLGSIAPGATVERTLHAGAGSLSVSITRADGSTQELELDNYLDEDDVRGGRTYTSIVDDTSMKRR